MNTSTISYEWIPLFTNDAEGEYSPYILMYPYNDTITLIADDQYLNQKAFAFFGAMTGSASNELFLPEFPTEKWFDGGATCITVTVRRPFYVFKSVANAQLILCQKYDSSYGIPKNNYTIANRSTPPNLPQDWFILPPTS